jgi:hypothetical protein
MHDIYQQNKCICMVVVGESSKHYVKEKIMDKKEHIG